MTFRRCLTEFLALSVLVLTYQATAQVCVISGTSIRFRPLEAGPPRSYLLRDEQPGQTQLPEEPEIETQAVFPKIVVQVINSEGEVDREQNLGTIEVTVIGAGGRIFSDGSSVSIFRGEAHFNALTVTAGANGDLLDPTRKTIQLRFTANRPQLPLALFHNASIDTGLITVHVASNDIHKLAFSPRASWISYADEKVGFVANTVMQTIRVNLLTTKLVILTQEITQQGFSVGVELSSAVAPDGSPLTLSGNSARLRDLDGVAVFKELIIHTTSTATSFPGVYLRFNLTAEGEELILASGEIYQIFQDASFDDDNLGFVGAEGSFMYTQNQLGITAKAGVAFPPVKIQLLDKSGFPSTTQFTGLIVTATCDRADLYGTVSGVVGGVATFDQLAFENGDLAEKEYQPFVITFTAGAQGGLGVGGKKLYTGWIDATAESVENIAGGGEHSLRFRQNSFDSYFNAPNVDASFSLYISFPTPIQIELLNAENQVNTSTTLSLKITASGTEIDSSGTVAFQGGVATFSEIRFKQQRDIPARLIFTTSDNTLQTFTGEITLSANTIASYDLRFQPLGGSAIGRVGMDLFATKGYAMLAIVIEILDSVGNVDSSGADGDIGITATADGATLSNSYVRTTSGVAVFDSLTFVSETAGDYILTFTASTTDTTVVNGKSLKSGTIKMTNVLTPSYRVRFDQTTSYIAYEGDSRPVQDSGDELLVIPSISIILVDSIGNSTNLDLNANLEISVTSSSGIITSTDVASQTFVKGLATFTGLMLTGAFDPVLTFCVSNKDSGRFSPADGQCISSGSLPFYTFPVDIAGLKIEATSEYLSDLTIKAPAASYEILSGAQIRCVISVLNSQGISLPTSSGYNGLKIEANSDVDLTGTGTVSVDDATGVAIFEDLTISANVPVGVTPIITFSAIPGSDDENLRIPSLSTGLLTVVGSGGQTEGTHVVAEVLSDYATFDFTAWQTATSYLLNIEIERISKVRVALGKGNEFDPNAVTEDSILDGTSGQEAEWEGTRVEFMFLEPLSTSLNLKSSDDLAQFFISLKPGCGATANLMLRKAFLRGTNNASCDWGIFQDNILGARQCLETSGFEGYCECYVPMFTTIAPRCVGIQDLTDLCLDTLTAEANCLNPEIRTVCEQLEFPDAPRLGVGASGAFLFLALPPVLYLAQGSFFEKAARPTAGRGKVSKAEFVRSDHHDFL